MTDHVAEIDPFAPGALDQETELAALAHALEFASGFSLLFVVCNPAPQRRQLMAEMRERLPELRIQEIIFNEPVNHLLDALRELLDSPLPDAVFVSGLEHSLPSIAEAATTSFIANLNASRNSFPQALSRPIVLWVPEYVLTAIAQGAPDFFSIRSGVYSFAATPEERAEFARTLFAGEHWQAQSLPLHEKRDRIAAIQQLLADYKSLPANQQRYKAEVNLLDRLGSLFYAQGNYAEAIRQFQQAIKLTEDVNDRAATAGLLERLGVLHSQRGEYAEALECFEQALQVKGQFGHLPSIASLLHNIGNIHYLQEDFDKAAQYYEQSLEIEKKLGHQANIANSLHQLGMLHMAREDYAEALRHYEQSLQIAKELGYHTSVAASLHQLGMLHQDRGEYHEAQECYEQSLRIKEALGDRVGIANSHGQIGKLFSETERYEEAFPLLLNALNTFIQLQSPYARLAVDNLRTLRARWGQQAFDVAWREATGEDIPDWLQESGKAAS